MHDHETSRLQTTWAQHVAASYLGVQTTRAAIVRRAITHYTAHLERLLATRIDALQLEAERCGLRLAARETTTEIPEALVTERPPRPLRTIIADYRAMLPTIMDKINADLNRWKLEGDDARLLGGDE